MTSVQELEGALFEGGRAMDLGVMELSKNKEAGGRGV
jgi:hypothetical protein